MNLFGRSIPPQYVSLQPKIYNLYHSHCSSERAIGSNIVDDERVSMERATSYLECCEAVATTAIAALEERSLESGIEILDVSRNRQNIAYLPKEVANPELPVGTRLVTVLRIFPLLAKWLRSYHLDRDIALVGDDLDGSVSDSLTDWLQECDGSAECMALLRQDISNAHRTIIEPRRRDTARHRNWQEDRIVWVALEDDFFPIIDEPVKSWLEALGIGNMLDTRAYGQNPLDDWFVLLAYDAARTSGLARPTVIDAGVYAWHYPSPADRPVYDGGRTVILGESPALAPLREFVHTTRRIAPGDILLVRQYRPTVGDFPDLETARIRHKTWMIEHLTE